MGTTHSTETAVAGAASTLLEAQAALADALRVIGELDVRSLTAEDRLEFLRTLAAGENSLHGHFLNSLSVAEASQDAKLLGHGTIQAMLTDNLRLAPAQARQAVRDAQTLREHPETMDALLAGRISAAHASQIVSGVNTAKAVAGGSTEAEHILLELAGRATPRDVHSAVLRMRHTVVPDEVERDFRIAQTRSVCYLNQTFDGMWHLDALLDPERGAVLQSALDGLIGQKMRSGTGEEEGAPAQTTSQARAEALAQLAAHMLDCGTMDRRGGARPHLTVTVPLETLTYRSSDASSAPESTSAPAPDTVDGEALGDEAGNGPPPAMTSWGDALPASAARRLACDADITRVIIDNRGQPLDVGRTIRLATAAQRRALEVRDAGCTYPGCDRPPGWCDAHHLVSWLDGGPTDLDNLTLLCRRHHTLVHAEGWPRVSHNAIPHPRSSAESDSAVAQG